MADRNASSTSTRTPSSRCSTGPPGSTSSSAAAAADGQPALGITDHGNMYGVLPFYAACRKAGITPVIGFEAYMAHERRDERLNTRGKIDDTGGEGEGGKKAWYHLTLLAENNTGYRNLIQLASRAFLEGYYRKPKVDWEILADHSEGVIATHRLPRRPRAAVAARTATSRRRCTRRASCRTSSAATTSSSSCRTTASPRSTRPTRNSSRSPPRSARRCSPPTTATTRAPKTRRHTTRCCACRPTR